MHLNDKVIIITGGCQGLGRSMAEYFAAKGANLALVDLNQEKLDQAVAASVAAAEVAASAGAAFGSGSATATRAGRRMRSPIR